MRNSYFDAELHFVQTEYGKQPPFSSFLPAFAGPWGIPTWCNYNNRGQAICSFGVQDKDHAILEFIAASTAYRCTALTGFRTFLKQGGIVVEPFADSMGTMILEPNALRLTWKNEQTSVEVVYFTLPNERMAGLCRRLRIQNLLSAETVLELLDGLATIVPYGVCDEKLKQEPNLSTAWMRVEKAEEHLPCFGIRASMEDSTRVSEISGRNFRLAFAEDERLLPALVRPELVFGWDTSLLRPVAFEQAPLSALLHRQLVNENFLPCCMTAWQGTLPVNGTVELWEFYGQANDEQELRAFCAKAQNKAFFERKLTQGRALTEALTAQVRCKTADPIFDGYISQTFLDNVMRGGFPYCLGSGQDTLPVYLYSRKHGDPEREYNAFYLDRAYFSQGNANFRDICQNRRSDTFFHPNAGQFNLQLFFELLQPDGYNPLVLEPVSYRAQHPEQLTWQLTEPYRKEALELLSTPFTMGNLAMAAENWHLPDAAAFLAAVLGDSVMEPNAEFQAGYWSDHWTYLLDLLESELAIYPEQEAALLFGAAQYRWFSAQADVLPQTQRYCQTERGLRQYHCVAPRTNEKKWVTAQDGSVVYSTLFEKLLLLCTVKSATLDPSGAAVEMEGGKPGWNDALNGLPAQFGAGLAESCELLRLLDYLIARQPLYPRQIELHEEITELLWDVSALTSKKCTDEERWYERNRIRDRYRAQTRQGFSGKNEAVPAERLLQALKTLATALRMAIDTATAENGGICPTYYSYQAGSVRSTEDGLFPTKLVKKSLPLFLEGPTRWLRTSRSTAAKIQMATAVQDSTLYDHALKMYRLNASLKNESFEIGRIRAFPDGWLENASIWLHMEYKYLLSLLKSGLYEQFFADFRNAAIPFLSPEHYGRSTMENSSFLVSSLNANTTAHGRGYVSRLSGSTAELISIWLEMFFGGKPFQYDSSLCLRFRPAIPEYLIGSRQTVSATFLGTISVTYHLSELSALVPENYQIIGYCLDSEVQISGDRIPEKWAKQIRDRRIKKIDVFCEGRQEAIHGA